MAKPSSIFRGRTGCCLALLALAAAGCQAAVNIPTLGHESAAKIEDGKVAFGKISVIGRNGPIIWKGFTCQEVLTFDCPDVFRVYVFPKDVREPVSHLLKGDGSFYWVLAPGEYTIGGFKFEDYEGARRKYSVTGRIAATFAVPPDKPNVYLGTTTVFLGRGRCADKIEDEYDSARNGLKEQKDSPPGEPVKSLAVLDRVPGEDKVAGICSGIWDLECTKEIRGVQALSPKMERNSFAAASSRNPLLRWEASDDAEVTYDIVVFEALPLDTLGLKVKYIKGPIVEYARDVKAAQYKLKTELKAATKYYGSVRLRKGGTVSSWSTVSYRYAAFLLVAAVWGSGSGIYFNFSTP